MSDSGLEGTLCAAYVEQAELYGQALPLAERLAASIRDGNNVDALLQPLLALLDRLALISTRIADVKTHWQQTGRRPGSDLQSILARLEVSIRSVQQRLSEAEQEAHKHQARLTPELDRLIRGKLMIRAYQNHAAS